MRSLAALLLLTASAFAAEPTKLVPYTKPTLVAHRGASGDAPEHTTAAYELAVKYGANFVEPDVQLTKDGVLVCLHDATLERTTNVEEVFPDRAKEVKGKKTWPVVEFTLKEIQQLDAGAWKDKKFTGQKMLTLQQAIDTVKGKCGLLIETKYDAVYAKLGLSMEKELMVVLKANKLDTTGADPKTPVVIQSFSAESLKAMRKEGCTLPQSLLVGNGDWTAEKLKAAKEYADGFAPSKDVVLKRPDVVKDAHALGMSVSVWTFRTGQSGQFKTVTEEMTHFLTELNVDAVITDNPDQFPHAKPTVLAPYTKPTNIAHRGASGDAPEHTLAAYELALKHGGDFVEPDLQLTKDGVLVCLHDTALERTTNVKEVFPDRAKEVNGRKAWPVAEFTLKEIQTLDAGTWKDKKFAGQKVPTFQQMIDAVKGKAGIIPETKAPEVYGKLGLNMEKELMAVLKANKLDTPGVDPKTPVVIQSFSAESLKVLRKDHACKLPLVYLFNADQSAEKLKAMKEYADGIAPNKAVVLKRPGIVKDARDLGMSVTVWTCRSGATGEFKDVKAEMTHLLKELKVDAIFTDNPDQFPR